MANQTNEFIQEVAKYAVKYSKETGVPASLTIAQAILESGWGRSGLAKKDKNLFGIKGTGSDHKTKEFVNGKWVTITAAFRKYETFEGSVRDHNQMIRRMKRYKAVIGERDYRKACRAIAAAGYATDPGYADKLIEIIEANNLQRFDDQDPPAEQPNKQPAKPEPAKPEPAKPEPAKPVQTTTTSGAIDKKDADAIIHILQEKWAAAQSKEEKAEIHRLANVIRIYTKK